MKIGEAFQLADDLLDQTGTSDEIGKAIDKDLKQVENQSSVHYLELIGRETNLKD